MMEKVAAALILLGSLALLAEPAGGQWRVYDMEERAPTQLHLEVYRQVAECAGRENRTTTPPGWARADRIYDGERDQPVAWDPQKGLIILDRHTWRNPFWISLGVIQHLHAGRPVPVRVLDRCIVGPP